ncbi:MAG TPA: Crp/Fnr family transcriptional regulator, partial [Fibrobacteria bacterium]|nr:Crp/Fnr family transcriptional regulator [Fibrobacteria bacterium]
GSFRFRSAFEILRTQPVFAGVSDGELIKFTALGEERRVEPDHVLIPVIGRARTPLAMILEGEGLLACGQGAEELFLRTLEPGDLVGEIDAFASLPRPLSREGSATVVRERAAAYEANEGPATSEKRPGTLCDATAHTVTIVRLIEWDHDAMREAVRRWPDVALGLLGVMARRQRDMQRRVAGLCGQKAPRRLARALTALLEERGVPHRDDAGRCGLLLPRTPSRTRLSGIAGMARETASRLLSAWERRGWISAWHGDLLVWDLRQLQRLAGQT